MDQNSLRRQDPFSNVSCFKILDSTLRDVDGIDIPNHDEVAIEIAAGLSRSGVDYLELPCLTNNKPRGLTTRSLRMLGFKGKTMVRACSETGVRAAVTSGINAIVLEAQLTYLKHGNSQVERTVESLLRLLRYAQSLKIEVFVEMSNATCTNIVDLLHIYREMDRAGATAVVISDDMGYVTPRQVYELVKTVRGVIGCAIQVRFCDLTSCAVAASFCALEAGAAMVNTTTSCNKSSAPLSGFLARMSTACDAIPDFDYDMRYVRDVDEIMAEAQSCGQGTEKGQVLAEEARWHTIGQSTGCTPSVRA